MFDRRRVLDRDDGAAGAAMRASPSVVRPTPSTASEPGSGTALDVAVTEELNVNVSPRGALMVSSSVSENGPVRLPMSGTVSVKPRAMFGLGSVKLLEASRSVCRTACCSDRRRPPTTRRPMREAYR